MNKDLTELKKEIRELIRLYVVEFETVNDGKSRFVGSEVLDFLMDKIMAEIPETTVTKEKEEEADLQKVLQCFINAYRRDFDACYIGYGSIEMDTKLTRKQIKPLVEQLKSDGIIDFSRGLMDYDGRVAGSGWGIVDVKKAEIYLEQYKNDRGRV